MTNQNGQRTAIDKLSTKATSWVGTPTSIIIHTILFVGVFAFKLVGVAIDTILLVLTTVVSLEAIYLAIFIQMTVNRNTESLEEVEDDLEEIQEDFRGLEDDVEDLSEDIDKIQENDEEGEKEEASNKKTLVAIEEDIHRLLKDIETLKKQNS